MKTSRSRVAICVLAPLFLLLYLSVVLVAIVTSGQDIVGHPGAWYAMLAPVLYVGLVYAYATRVLTRRLPLLQLVVLHLALLPTLVFSFMALGLLVPVFAVLWWMMERESTATVAPAP